LMAGAIFAIIIIFLQGLSLIRILIQPCRIYSLTYVSIYKLLEVRLDSSTTLVFNLSTALWKDVRF
jgi:hypothetical protein